MGQVFGLRAGPWTRISQLEQAASKAKDRCKEWAGQSLGVQLSAFVYKAYVISTLGFVAQLEHMLPDWVKWEEQMLRILVPGPRRWC